MIKLKTEIENDLIPVQYIEGECPGCHYNIKIATPESFLDWESAYEELQKFVNRLQGQLSEAHREVWRLRRVPKDEITEPVVPKPVEIPGRPTKPPEEECPKKK